MPNFKKFATGSTSDEPISIRYRQIQDNGVGSRVEKVWATDFERCVNREDYEKYISKYGRYKSNKYVSQAKAKIKSLDAGTTENAKIEIKRDQTINTSVSEPKKGDSCLILILRIIGTILLCVILFGVAELLSTVINRNSMFMRLLLMACGLPIMNLIWKKD